MGGLHRIGVGVRWQKCGRRPGNGRDLSDVVLPDRSVTRFLSEGEVEKLASRTGGARLHLRVQKTFDPRGILGVDGVDPAGDEGSFDGGFDVFGAGGRDEGYAQQAGLGESGHNAIDRVKRRLALPRPSTCPRYLLLHTSPSIAIITFLVAVPMQLREEIDPLAPQREAALFYGLFLRGHAADTLRKDIDVPKPLVEKRMKRHKNEQAVREELRRI